MRKNYEKKVIFLYLIFYVQSESQIINRLQHSEKDGRSNFYGVGALIIIHDQKVPYFIFLSFLKQSDTTSLLPQINKIALLKSHKLFKIRFQSRGQPKTFSQTFLNKNKSWKWSNLVQKKKVEMVFCYQNCSDIL